jgi:3-oxoacyl-[acyl-carrier protein] reductase
MRLDFTGRTAVVTGATRGIGERIADDLERLGASLILTGTDPDVTAELNAAADRAGRKRRYVVVDFLDREQLTAFSSQLETEERIDILINNAGINRISLIDRSRVEDWDSICDVNLRAPVVLTRSVSALMRRQSYGRIVNIASIFGVVSKAERSFYSTTKFGLRGLTRASALDLAKDNILVNAVSPGFVSTDLTREILGAEQMRDLAEQVPLGRLADPSDISPIVLFLASELNSYLTGQNIVVDGGFVSA